jgi:hypothetical protein
VLGLLGFSVLVGVAASSPSTGQTLISIGFLALFFLFAWLWQTTLQARKNATPMTRRQWAAFAAVVIILLAMLAGLMWL